MKYNLLSNYKLFLASLGLRPNTIKTYYYRMAKLLEGHYLVNDCSKIDISSLIFKLSHIHYKNLKSSRLQSAFHPFQRFEPHKNYFRNQTIPLAAQPYGPFPACQYNTGSSGTFHYSPCASSRLPALQNSRPGKMRPDIRL